MLPVLAVRHFEFLSFFQMVETTMDSDSYNVRSLTCAFLQASRPFTMHPQLAVEVFLPEFSEPNISSVVGQRAAAEIPIKCCKKKRQSAQKLKYIW